MTNDSLSDFSILIKVFLLQLNKSSVETIENDCTDVYIFLSSNSVHIKKIEKRYVAGGVISVQASFIVTFADFNILYVLIDLSCNPQQDEQDGYFYMCISRSSTLYAVHFIDEFPTMPYSPMTGAKGAHG